MADRSNEPFNIPANIQGAGEGDAGVLVWVNGGRTMLGPWGCRVPLESISAVMLEISSRLSDQVPPPELMYGIFFVGVELDREAARDLASAIMEYLVLDEATE